jgi:hypothetical protein
MREVKNIQEDTTNLDWMIILFVIYLYSFKVGKLEESACEVILVAGPSLENWGLGPYGSILMHQIVFFWVLVSKNCVHPLEGVLYSKTFPMV